MEDGFPPRPVALKVFERATVLHNMPLSPNLVKVKIEKVHIIDGVVLLPTNEVFIEAQTFQTFIA